MSDWLRPDWWRTQMRAWTPPGMEMPQPVAAALRTVVEQFGLAPAMVGRQLIDAVTSRLIGREITINAGGRETSLVLRLLRFVRPPVGLMIGQVGDLELELDDVRTSSLRIEHLRLEVCNLHLQPGMTTTVVAAPIRMRAVIHQSVVAEAIARRSHRVEIDLRADGTARAHLTGRRQLGHVDLAPRVEGGALVLRPTRLVVRGRDRLSSLVQRLPAYRLPLPRLGDGVHVSDVAVEEARLVVHAVYEEWRREVTPEDLDQLMKRVERFDGGVLDISQD